MKTWSFGKSCISVALSFALAFSMLGTAFASTEEQAQSPSAVEEEVVDSSYLADMEECGAIEEASDDTAEQMPPEKQEATEVEPVAETGGEDTPFSPFDASSRLDIDVQALLSNVASDGDVNAQYLSASRFKTVLNYALQFHGWRYQWGGKSPSTSFDCSGLVSYTYNHALGAHIAVGAAGIYTEHCYRINEADARPGDLVFWRGTYGSINHISHVGIYCGGDVVYAAGDPIGFYSVRSCKNIYGQEAVHFFGRLRAVDNGPNVQTAAPINVEYGVVFNNGFYTVYNDTSFMDPAAGLGNFLNKGMAKGLRASIIFDPQYYKAKYADLRAAFGDNMKKYYEHFMNHGAAEGREGSAEFSLAYYKSANPDLRAAYGNNNAAYYVHFAMHGLNEGRKCNSEFNVVNYYRHYPDLQAHYAKDFGCYYGHYYRAGKSEGRTSADGTVRGTTKLDGIDYSDVYDYGFYVKNSSDVNRHYGGDPIDVLRHFVICGTNEGRQGSAKFNVVSYYNKYPDLRAAFGASLKSYYLHYINYGKKEGRIASGVTTMQGMVSRYGGIDYSPVYDPSLYYSNYKDLQKAFGFKAGGVVLFNDSALLAHFINHGMNEGRIASKTFNVGSYYNRYPDLRRAFGANLKALYMHYLNYGKAERRNGWPGAQLTGHVTSHNGIDYSPVYDGSKYISSHRDLQQAFTRNIGAFSLVDDSALLAHFVDYGMNEGRQAHSGFNVHKYKSSYADLQMAFGDNLKHYYLHYVNNGRFEDRVAS